MADNSAIPRVQNAYRKPKSSNVKSSEKYERFGETIRYLTVEELQKLFDSIDDYRHKLMLQIIYELGCRVGEFVRIRLRHLDFQRSVVIFPAENTKTGHRRSSALPRGLMNEVVSLLQTEGRLGKRDLVLRKPDSYLFHPSSRANGRYTENRLRQIFRQYAARSSLDQEYGQDCKGRSLHRTTIHSLRHSHIMHYIHIHKLPLPIVQRQVGHRSLKSTSMYLNPSDEALVEAYAHAQTRRRQAPPGLAADYHNKA